MFNAYDIIVVGGGHAGCEAAAAAARMGSRVLLVTMNMNTIGQMSCNPAMGGVAKGQIIREIDALGGLSGVVTDRSMIQFRMLNRSKGPAMWSPRSQNDRMHFAKCWRLALESIKNIDFWQETVQEITVHSQRVTGIRTARGLIIQAKSVILTNGTFLNGVIHIGEKSYSGGRSGEKATHHITGQLIRLGFKVGRMKTGTPPRIDGRTLNYDQLTEQLGDEAPSKFSFTDTPRLTHQKKCWLAYTNEKVHNTLKEGFSQSPLFNGKIAGVGPRYCPSIEDKICRFSDRNRHQLFVEPEGRETVEIYLNGFSSSLPEEIQYKALTHISGFENVRLFQPGYAIEYDYFSPTQLKPTLETKHISNLFFAGQINGTTGYEEASCQGLMAGINAHHNIHNIEPFILKRSEAYIGVLIDDLINKGTDEPYRMFTSRAEYRILLRQDNADLRLTEKGYNIGLVDKTRIRALRNKRDHIEKLRLLLYQEKADLQTANAYLSQKGYSNLHTPIPLAQLIKRPEITIHDMLHIAPRLKHVFSSSSEEVQEQVEIQEKYAPYIARERELAETLDKLEDMKIQPNINYDEIMSLSAEGREKLKKIRPENIGQMKRISGVSPADVSLVSIFLKK